MDKQNMRARCDALLTSLVGKNLIHDWWNSPNKAFDNKTPESVFSTNPETIYNYLMNYGFR